MDEFFDKLKDGAYKAKDGAERIAKEVAKRTSNAITYTKLTFAVNEAQKKVNDVYTEIGKNMYEKYLEGEGYDDTFTASVSYTHLDVYKRQVHMRRMRP